MLKKRKIVYLVTQTKYGGAQKYVLDLASHFRLENDISIVVGESKNIDTFFMKRAKEMSVPVYILNSMKRQIDIWSNIQSIFELRKLLKKIKPDILHINSSMAGFVGSISALLYNLDPYVVRIKVVYTAHGFVYNEPRPTVEKNIYLMIEKFSAVLKSKIITVSDYDKQSALNKKVAKTEKLATIHVGVEEKDLEFLDRQTARQYLGITQEKFTIGTIASLYPTKGLSYLVEAMSLINEDIDLTLIGEGPERKKLEKLIDKYNLKNVQLLGNKESAFKFLKAFDLFILPSVKEGLPYTLLEAGFARIPIIATRVGGIPEIISDSKLGILIDAREPQQMKDSILKLYSDPALRRSLADLNYKNIKENFSLEKMLQQTTEVYESLVPKN